jgi:hypothetical protein
MKMPATRPREVGIRCREAEVTIVPAAANPPTNAFGAFAPSANRPFDDRRVAHLLRRAGFGPTAERLQKFSGQSPASTIDWLFNYSPDSDPLNEKLEDFQGMVTFNKIEAVQEWCLFRMVYSPRPLQEKMALFWHDHFATSASKVDQPLLMHKQLELFRQKGLGSFRDLLIAVSHDPAMLIWLDGRNNRKGKPNENYAREIMELFTLGVGHYTEQDVQELARAFTGWQIEGDRGRFNQKAFDEGSKKVFGQTGPFDSEGAIDLILSQPAAPKYLSNKLLQEFVHPHPTQEHIDHYATRLIETKWDMKTVLREMLSSELFFSDWAYRSKIKSPIELVVGATVAVGGKANMPFLRESTTKMGQNILFPPNVKGWDGEETWINSNTVLLRFNFGLSLSTQRGDEFVRQSKIEKGLLDAKATTGEQVVNYMSRLLLDGTLTPKFKTDVLSYMDLNDKQKKVPFELKEDKPNAKVRGLMHLMMSTPEYQLA